MTRDAGQRGDRPAEPPADTVLIVDDDPGVRALLARVLEGAGFTTYAAESGEEALAQARSQRPSLVLLDIRLPGVSGYEVCHELRSTFGDEVAIVFVSGVRTEPFDRAAGLMLGADDYLVKPFAPDELVARVRRLLERATPSSPRALNLTGRELEILGLLAEGLQQAEIAARLVISPKTVATHIEHVLGKLEVHSRAQAVARAYRDGLLQPSPSLGELS